MVQKNLRARKKIDDFAKLQTNNYEKQDVGKEKKKKKIEKSILGYLTRNKKSIARREIIFITYHLRSLQQDPTNNSQTY